MSQAKTGYRYHDKELHTNKVGLRIMKQRTINISNKATHGTPRQRKNYSMTDRPENLDQVGETILDSRTHEAITWMQRAYNGL